MEGFIYPNFSTNVCFVAENESMAASGLWQNPCGVSKEGPKILLFNIFKAIKRYTIALKKLYSWPKKLYQFLTNLLFWLIYQLLVTSHPTAFLVG